MVPEYVAIAEEMLGRELTSIERAELDKHDKLIQKAGGELVSRQAIAIILISVDSHL